MTVDARCRLYGGLWVVAAVILAWRALPYLGLGDGAAVALRADQRTPALVIAAVIGVAKGLTVMRRAARKARARIAGEGIHASPATVFRWPVVLLVVFMMALGLALRHAPYPEPWRAWVVGVLYPAVALALLIGAGPLLWATPKGPTVTG